MKSYLHVLIAGLLGFGNLVAFSQDSSSDLNNYFKTCLPNYTLTSPDFDFVCQKHAIFDLDQDNVIIAANIFWPETAKTPLEVRETTDGILVFRFNKTENKIVWNTRISKRELEGYGEGKDITSDGIGNIYIGGFVNTDLNDKDFLTIKISPSGELLWSKKYDGSNYTAVNMGDHVTSITTDSLGNVTVAGPSNMDDIKTTSLVQYDSNGNQKWESRFTPSSHLSDSDPERNTSAWGYELGKIAADSKGNTLILGTSYHNGQSEIHLAKFNASGESDWTSIYAYHSAEDLKPISMIIAPDENIYIAGEIGNDFLALVQFNKNGSMNWDSVIDLDRPWYKRVNEFTLDQNTGNVVLTADIEIREKTNFTQSSWIFDPSGKLQSSAKIK